MIGTILKNIRKMKKITQAEVGRKLYLADNTISCYETEKSNPTFNTILKFAKLCDFNIIFENKKTGKQYTVEELSKEMDF